MKTAVIIAGVLRHCDVSSRSWNFPMDVDFYLSTWDLTEYVYNGDEFYQIHNELKKLENIKFKHKHIESYKNFYQTYKGHIGFELSRFFYLVKKMYDHIKDEKYNRVILIRPDLHLFFKEKHIFVNEVKSLKNNSAIFTFGKLGIDLSKKHNKEYFREYLKKAGKIPQICDDHFIFDWTAFENFVKIWPNSLFDRESCPHRLLFNFFLTNNKVNLSNSTSFFTDINRAPFSEYLKNNLDITAENIHKVSAEYEKRCKEKFPNKNKTLKEIEEYFKNN